MKIQEEVVRRRQTLQLEEPERTYPEIKDLLERRMSFDHVSETQHRQEAKNNNLKAKVETVEAFDKYTQEKLEIFIVIDKDKGELDLQIKGKLVTEYNTSGWRGNLWYYAYRALYEKFLYGHVREGWEDAVEEKVDELLERIRQNVGGQ
ncbi:MAG: hypothetical protein ABEJ83_00635 [Candidatus Nanohaloarchaea archaeon]